MAATASPTSGLGRRRRTELGLVFMACGALTGFLAGGVCAVLLTESPVSPSPEQVAPGHRLVVAGVAVGIGMGFVTTALAWRRKGARRTRWLAGGALGLAAGPFTLLFSTWLVTDGAAFGYVNSHLAEHETFDGVRVEGASITGRKEGLEWVEATIEPDAGFVVETSITYSTETGLPRPIDLERLDASEEIWYASTPDPLRPGRTCVLEVASAGRNYRLVVDCERTLVGP